MIPTTNIRFIIMKNSFIYKKPGLWHILTSQHSNDCAVIKQIADDVYLLCLSDGSSSSLLRKEAARTACNATVEFFTANYSDDIFSVESNLSTELVEYVENRLEKLTASYVLDRSDADCTLLAAVVSHRLNRCMYYSAGADRMWHNGKMITVRPSDPCTGSLSRLYYINSAVIDIQPQDTIIMATDGRFPLILDNDALKKEILCAVTSRDYTKRKYFLDQLTPLDDCTVVFYEC